jgi:hypothetical protein
MQHLNIIMITLILSLTLLLSLHVKSQENDYDMTDLANATSDINYTIGAQVGDFSQWSQESMLDGTTIIYNLADDTQYHLTSAQMDTFNQAYADGLVNSTPEALTAVLLNDMIDVEQGTYDDQKEALTDAAKEIATVTEIADKLVNGDQQTKINAEAYATENDLRAIKESSRQKFNTSISGMLEASITKNMIEGYAQDAVVIDVIAGAFMATNTVMDFFMNTSVSIDELTPTQLNLDWEQHNVGVESFMYGVYANDPQSTLEMTPR